MAGRTVPVGGANRPKGGINGPPCPRLLRMLKAVGLLIALLSMDDDFARYIVYMENLLLFLEEKGTLYFSCIQ